MTSLTSFPQRSQQTNTENTSLTIFVQRFGFEIDSDLLDALLCQFTKIVFRPVSPTAVYNVSGATLIPIAWMPLLCHCTKTGVRQV